MFYFHLICYHISVFDDDMVIFLRRKRNEFHEEKKLLAYQRNMDHRIKTKRMNLYISENPLLLLLQNYAQGVFF